MFRPASADPSWVTYLKVTPPSGPPPPPPPTGHAGLVGSFGGMAIRNSSHMIVTRNNDVPLRTKDGGATWTPMESCRLVANFHHGMLYSWSGNTLILMGSGGTLTADASGMISQPRRCVVNCKVCGKEVPRSHCVCPGRGHSR